MQTHTPQEINILVRINIPNGVHGRVVRATVLHVLYGTRLGCFLRKELTLGTRSSRLEAYDTRDARNESVVCGQHSGEHVLPNVARGVVEVYENARDSFCRGRNAGPWEVKDAHRYNHRHVHTEKNRKVPANS